MSNPNGLIVKRAQMNFRCSRFTLAIFALFVIPISGLSIDIYIPSLPTVGHYFKVDKTWVQLSITTYLVGFSLLQLFAGTISDSFGRKKPFIVAMICYITISFLIPKLSNINHLLVMRFLQGAAVAGLSVPMRAVISDLFEGKEFYKMINYMTIAWALGPIIAPTIGGYLQYYYGWHAPFYFLAIYGAIVFIIICMFLPETSTYRHPFELRPVLKRYREIVTYVEFLGCLLCLGLLYSLLVLFGVIGSFLIQVDLHYSPIAFGNMALLIGLAWFLGNITNRILIEWHIAHKVKICFWVMWWVVIGMLLINLQYGFTIYSLMIPSLALIYFAGIVFPNYFAQCLALFPKSAASANALMGSLMTVVAGITTAIGSILKPNSPIPFILLYLVACLICLVVFYGINNKRKLAIVDN